MEILQKTLELDFIYLETFTKRIDTSWGCFFYNEDQPNYFDANHAHISISPQNPKSVINEVIHFYTEKKLIPRFYLYDYDKHQNFIKELESDGFNVEELVGPVQLWNKQIFEHKKDPLVTIEKVTNLNFNDALEIECSIKEFGGRDVREKAFPEEFKHPNYTYYLLRYNREACSTACIFEHGDQARMESVATLSKFRGKGLIGELISHIQQEVSNRGFEYLWVFPINERVEKVYQRYGFDTIGTVKMGHAFLGGKSIGEIREG
jgi:GNAT superfamily N-acetyltransferase